MQKFQQGDYEAFEVLYTRHKQPLFRFMLGLCSQQAVTEELFQDVWLKLVDAKQRYQPSAKFTTYLYQIARNRVIDHFRKASTQSEHNVIDIDVSMEQQGQFQPDTPEQLVHAAQQSSTLSQLIAQLPAEQREVFLLKENTDMSLQDIAQCLGENSEAIKSRLRYAVQKLKQGLEG